MTQVRAGGQVNIDSGRDTNLIGATVSGDKVVADVGRDLNIASVQDTSTFKSRDQSIGGSATIGYGSGASVNASRSRVDADYASVGQQAGIMAGDGQRQGQYGPQGCADCQHRQGCGRGQEQPDHRDLDEQ